MPLLSITTSTEPLIPEKSTALLEELSSYLAQTLGKPEMYVMTALNCAVPMTFAGKTEPACYVELKNIGRFTSLQTRTLSRALCAQLSAALGVASSRIYIEFSDAQPHLWGYNGDTFE
jgi:phenylpyruvate tautomerase